MNATRTFRSYIIYVWPASPYPRYERHSAHPYRAITRPTMSLTPLPTRSVCSSPQGYKVLLVSPFHAGSHRAWAEGLMHHSQHDITLVSLPGRFWKWRMQGGMVPLARSIRALLTSGYRPDILLVTDMVHLPVLTGLLADVLPAEVVKILYMHENQLTYPVQGKLDLSYAVMNWLSQMAADYIVFNSYFHLQDWFKHLPGMLRSFPDFRETATLEPLQARSHVLPVGIDPPIRTPALEPLTATPHILWNHRWDHDKRPDRFFQNLYRLQAAGQPFVLLAAGETFEKIPEAFTEAAHRLQAHIGHWGYAPSRQAYWDLLYQADLVISTTEHEFFGISVLEAIAAGAFPLLPRRFSYPELLPPVLHQACLYDDLEDLWAKTRQRVADPRRAPPSLVRHVRTAYAWTHIATLYDTYLSSFRDRARV